MQIDLTKLSSVELDELIVKAAQLRANMLPTVGFERPQTVEAINNPAWFCSPQKEGVLFQIKHHGFGWLAFLIPHAERVLLMSLLLQQSLIAVNPNDAGINPATTPATGGGGTLH